MSREEWVEYLSELDNAFGDLLVVYFGQDWIDDYGEPWTNVVRAFAAKRGPEQVRQVVADLDRLLGDDLSEDDIDWLLLEGMHSAPRWDRFGCATWREWLQMLREELRRYTQEA